MYGHYHCSVVVSCEHILQILNPLFLFLQKANRLCDEELQDRAYIRAIVRGSLDLPTLATSFVRKENVISHVRDIESQV